jgi:hypothetical protein
LRRELIQQVVMALRQEIRRTLAERVQRRVAGRGISRRAIDIAVDRVLGAIETAPASVASPVPEVVAAFTSPSAPDLGSRVRRALEREGVPASALGSATSGRHTVVTVRLPSDARGALDRVAAQLALPLSILDVAGGEER